jgi:hypothetical protein|tara:strand:- start:1322 stop:1450 length:129 start_codon:yes stop_codon:yes gene_type:complete
MKEIEELWETDEKELAKVQEEGGDILFEEDPVMKLEFKDYKG